MVEQVFSQRALFFAHTHSVRGKVSESPRGLIHERKSPDERHEPREMLKECKESNKKMSALHDIPDE